MRHVASYCAGFNVMGYKGDYQSTKNGKLLCAVSCDTALGYFPDGFYKQSQNLRKSSTEPSLTTRSTSA
ncbi:hypothetical protein MHBO_000048 [Bonamia ostreae]|uniref:Uncharacterized protein n=1 Tax=Bonamia ostreae TaxID=126728 RepID=A0ABV2AEA0_9EUKA